MASPAGPAGAYPILRVTWTGLSRGFIWLNGHNLGRYPELSPIDSIYLPECWLKRGKNALEIFDEEGQSPDQVKIEVKPNESRIRVAVSD
jgi:beta-galactosidase